MVLYGSTTKVCKIGTQPQFRRGFDHRKRLLNDSAYRLIGTQPQFRRGFDRLKSSGRSGPAYNIGTQPQFRRGFDRISCCIAGLLKRSSEPNLSSAEASTWLTGVGLAGQTAFRNPTSVPQRLRPPARYLAITSSICATSNERRHACARRGCPQHRSSHRSPRNPWIERSPVHVAHRAVRRK